MFEKRLERSHLNYHLKMAKIQPLQFGAKIQPLHFGAKFQILNPNAPNYFFKIFSKFLVVYFFMAFA